MSKLAGVDYRLIGVGAGVMAIVGLVLFGGPRGDAETVGGDKAIPVNLGFFPNVTHAPALVAAQNGAFQRALGNGARLNLKVLNAGPEAMEALLAGDIDVLYVGPGPALNAYLKTQGQALRIVSGVCEGGASLVASKKSGIQGLADLADKRVAVPQLGNTQDLSLRHFIRQEGLLPKDQGGNVDIIPVPNADEPILFKQGEIDAAWVPEPWASRLAEDTGANRVIDERSLWPEGRFTTTVLVVRTQFLNEHPEIVQELVNVNRDTIDWMAKNPEDSHKLVNRELFELAGGHNAKQVPEEAWNFMSFDASLEMGNLLSTAKAAYDCGYLKSVPRNVSEIFDPLFLKLGHVKVAR